MFGALYRLRRDKKGHEAYKEISSFKEFRNLVERVDREHENPKLAALAKAFEEMQEYPLVERFRRNKIHLYIDKKRESGDSFKARLIRESAGTAGARLKLIHLPEQFVEILDLEELKAEVAHEMGHILRADPHPRRNPIKVYFEDSHPKEYMADEIAVLLCRNPEAYKSALDKLLAHDQKVLESFKPQTPQQERFKHRLQQVLDPNNASKSHPSLNDRKKHIDEFAQRIAQAGYVAVGMELVRKLETEHRKLFPHHFDRPIDNPSR